MDINSAFPSTYLKAADLQGRSVDVNIAKVSMEDVGDDHKPVVYFMGKDKGLALNKTNSNAIAMMYGGETNNWSGQPISIYPTETEFGGKVVACIRVKAPGGQDITVFLAQRGADANRSAEQAQGDHMPAPGSDLSDEIPF